MLDSDGISSLIKQASALLPERAAGLRQEFEQALKPLLEKKLEQMNLVTREEFDQYLIQIERLEKKLVELETALAEAQSK